MTLASGLAPFSKLSSPFSKGHKQKLEDDDGGSGVDQDHCHDEMEAQQPQPPPMTTPSVASSSSSPFLPTPIKIRSNASEFITPRKIIPAGDYSPVKKDQHSPSSSPLSSPLSASPSSSPASKGRQQASGRNKRGCLAFFGVSAMIVGQLCFQYLYYKYSAPASFKLQSDGSSTYNKNLQSTFETESLNYFAPSLTFQYQSPPTRSRSRGEKTTERKQYTEKIQNHKGNACNDKAQDLKWEYYSTTATTRTTTVEIANTKTSTTKQVDLSSDADSSVSKSTTSRRLLIALYAGYDDYSTMFQHSTKIAKLYATVWGPNVSVVTIQGTAFAPGGCQPPGIHTTLNKIRLLFHAIDKTDEFDQLLLLDADTLITNTHTDITKLLPMKENRDKRYLVATGPVADTDKHRDDSDDNKHKKNADKKIMKSHSTKINNLLTGITLWNLHHPDIRETAIDWFQHSIDAAKKGKYNGDSEHLYVSSDYVMELRNNEFGEGMTRTSKSTIVHHYSAVTVNRENGNGKVEKKKKRDRKSQQLRSSSTTSTLQDRQKQLSKQAEQICKDYSKLCQELSSTSLTSTHI